MSQTDVKQKKQLDKKLVQSLNRQKIPHPKQMKYLFKVFNRQEKNLFLSAIGLLIVSIITLGGIFYFKNFIPNPTPGGEYTEGLIGAPQFINPLLSQTNDVDTDISRLIFSGLLRHDNNLQIVPDLAESWRVNEEQTEYTFIIKENTSWHDGTPVTADDIIFTLQSIQDPDFKSPLLVSLRGINIEKIDERTVKFILSTAYPSFIEVLTFGILPEHIWGEVPPVNANLTEYNLKPIGSGPWQFKSLTKDRLGNIKSYVLEPFLDYNGPKPYIEKLTFKFYPDFQTAVTATQNHSVDGISFLPKELKKELLGQKNLELYSFALPQYTAIFFNQKQNESLKDIEVRKALTYAINKPEILTEALQLEGAIIDGPLLPNFVNTADSATGFDQLKAEELLEDAKWEKITAEEYLELIKKQKEADFAAATVDEDNGEATTTEILNQDENETVETDIDPSLQEFFRKKGDTILEITLTTVDQPENTTAATLIKQAWEKIGVLVNLEIIQPGKIGRETIKPRNYQALLFGVIVGANPDPFPFWHSSQAQDPGLNLTLYANRKVDQLLETAQTTKDEQERQSSYQQFQNILSDELPAIFLYNPTYTYVVDKKINGINTDRVIVPADRMNGLSDWYIKTKRTYKSNTL